jgi:hypothetical protein
VGIAATRDRIGIEERFDLGVLLVHGIGVQQRSDVLTEAGDQIIGWLRKQVESGPGGPGRIEVLDVVAREPSGDAIPAAHAAIRITPPGTGQPSSTWVVAEAWWAEVFRPATFSEMLGWVLTIGPWVFASEMADINRRLEIGAKVGLPLRLALIPITLMVGLAMIMLAALLGFAITVLAAAVFVLASTNVPFLADAAKGFQRTLASEFGDAYVLTRSPVRFGAMASSVRTNIQNLREQCNQVAVVAHSQGTAVAWFALLHELLDAPPRSEGPEAEAISSQFAPPADPAQAPYRAPIGLFVTYGQALRKLTFALHLARDPRTIRQSILALASAVLVGLTIVTYVLSGSLLLAGLVATVATAAELFLLQDARKVWTSSGKHIEEDWREVLKVAPDIQWLDLWASADPATVGPLNVSGTNIDSYKIRNRASTQADHDVYWKNTTEFMAILGAKLFSLGGPSAYARPIKDPALKVAAMRRHARVMVLMTMRFLLFAAVVTGLAWTLVNPWFGEALIDLVDGLLPVFDDFFASPPPWLPIAAGAIPVLILWFLAWNLLQVLWNSMTATDDATYFRGYKAALWDPRWYGLGAMTALIVAGAAALLYLASGPALVAGYLIGSAFLVTLALAVLSNGGRSFAGSEATEETRLAIARIPVPRLVGLALVVVPAAILICLPVLVLFIDTSLPPLVVAAEAIALSIVLAIEGWREYGLFRDRFRARSAPLPEPPENKR